MITQSSWPPQIMEEGRGMPTGGATGHARDARGRSCVLVMPGIGHRFLLSLGNLMNCPEI